MAQAASACNLEADVGSAASVVPMVRSKPRPAAAMVRRMTIVLDARPTGPREAAAGMDTDETQVVLFGGRIPSTWQARDKAWEYYENGGWFPMTWWMADIVEQYFSDGYGGCCAFIDESRDKMYEWCFEAQTQDVDNWEAKAVFWEAKAKLTDGEASSRVLWSSCRDLYVSLEARITAAGFPY